MRRVYQAEDVVEDVEAASTIGLQLKDLRVAHGLLFGIHLKTLVKLLDPGGNQP
jgi:hypothetical protein